jgi:hypothetical protein
MLTWHARYMAAAAAVVLAIGGAGAILLLHGAGGKTRDRADVRDCGLVTCAALHASGRAHGHSGAVVIGAPVSIKRAGNSPSAAPTRSPAPTPAPSASPTPGPSPAPQPTASAPSGPGLTITYSTPDVWDGGFQGEFTIVNNGSTTVSNWQVVITLPGDQVDTAWDANWQPGPAGTVILTPASYDTPLKPGASQQVNFEATGDTVEPASCTFDGSACT